MPVPEILPLFAPPADDLTALSTAVHAGIPTYNNDDGKGPRIDLCCLPGSDCLARDPNFSPARNFEYMNGTGSHPLCCLMSCLPGS